MAAERSTRRRLRVLIIDGHEVSRAASAALLRTEGLDVCDTTPGAALRDLAERLEPDLVLIDTTPGDRTLKRTVATFCTLRCRPTVLVTSSAPRMGVDRSVANLPFIPKADICARAIFEAAQEHRGCRPEASGSSSCE